MKATILIVDDHPLLRSGLRKVLEQHSGLVTVREAASGREAVSQAAASKAGLILMDIHLPDMSGIEATRRVLEADPAAKVVIFSADASRRLVDSALEAGARGYLLKKSAAEELIHALDSVLAGRVYLSAEVSAGILDDYRKSLAGESKPSLSERQRQLLRLIAEGRRNKEIAAALKLTEHSVETYRARLMKKLGCSGTAELVRYAIREGIASP